ncbi:MAG: signal transduction histidine kinase [Candidatus Azotimanducaceae bacterium]
MRSEILQTRTRHKINRAAFLLAAIACITVFFGAVIIYFAQSLLILFLVSFLVLTVLLLTFDRNRLLQSIQTLEHKDQLLDAITDVYWEWDLNTGVFNYNNKLLEMLNYPEHADKDPRFWKEKLHPIDRPQQKYQLLRHLSDEAIPYYSEYRIQNSKGIYHWFAGRGKIVLKDPHGNPLLMCGRLDCIQERKDLEQSLIHAHKMDALGQLTGGIAHDFNNILASILGYTELAQDTNQDSNINRYLEQIQLAGTRAKSVLKKLLDFSRHSKADTRVICLQTEIQETLKMLESTFPSSICISQSFPSGDYYSRLDPNQLQRVLLNLCINARDAMSNKGNLSLRLEPSKVIKERCASCHGVFEGNYHILHINDDGVGVDPVISDKLFEPFFTTKEFGDGTGMGLAVVHGVVHDYNGHIQLASSVGTGTNIRLYFPAISSTNNKNSDSQKAAAESSTLVQLNKNILVIEDDKQVSHFLFDLLACYGCDVEIADSSIEAIQAISTNKKDYDLVLSDQTMPGITGTELASKLYTLKPDLPVVLYSGSKLSLDMCPNNVHQVLHKPINNKKLIDVIIEVSAANS